MYNGGEEVKVVGYADEPSGYIPLYVPERLYDKMCRFLARLLAREAGEDDGVFDPERLGNPSRLWREPDLMRLARDYDQLAVGVQMLLTLTSESPGEWVSFAELMEASGRTKRQLMGELGGFTQYLKKLFNLQSEYGTKAELFPVRLSYRDGQRYYTMPQDIANLWIIARREVDG